MDLRQFCYASRPIFTTSGENENEVCVGDYCLTICDSIRFIKDQGTFTADHFDALDEVTKKDFAKSVALFVLKLADGISNICGERDECNQAT